VCYQNNFFGVVLLYFCVDGFYPIFANWGVPIFLFDTGKVVFFFPEGLPVLRAGIAKTGEDEDGGLEMHVVNI